MVQSQRQAMNPELYERLIDRLGLALDIARTAVRLRNEAPVELELSGLSRAEFELITAYLATHDSRLESVHHEARVKPAKPVRESAKVYWLRDQDKVAHRPGKRHWQSGKPRRAIVDRPSTP